ncbi:hypothetical protein HQ535_11075 [bacterium]|nr:hypothetical protein [bacterium]
MSGRAEVGGGAGPLHVAAIIAAMAHLEEEQAVASAIPQTRPGRGQWVLSSIPRTTTAPHAVRSTPVSEGWSVGSTSEPE